MTFHKKLPLSAAVLLLMVPGFSGCGSLFKSEKPVEPIRVEVDDSTPQMTPAERDRRYRTTYSEGLKLAESGQYGVALGAFEQAATLRPDSADAIFNLGACHEAVGDPLRAINYYRRVLEMNPNDPDCYTNLGTSFIKLYYREKSPAWRKMAKESWERSLQLNPNQATVRSYLANGPWNE